jgi:hypothetical protein
MIKLQSEAKPLKVSILVSYLLEISVENILFDSDLIVNCAANRSMRINQFFKIFRTDGFLEESGRNSLKIKYLFRKS